MKSATEHIISDLSIAQPSDAVSDRPQKDRWIVLPYEGEVSGKMLWCPVRNHPPEVSVPLPALGLCRIHIGLYGSGTAPIWLGLFGTKDETKNWQQARLRLSNEDWYDGMTPEVFGGLQRFVYTSEAYWKTTELTGQSLVIARPAKEAYAETTTCIAYIRLVPVDQREQWPAETKRLICYLDSNFNGHYVDSRQDIKSHLEPLRDSDFGTVLWTTCREDSCYYPTNIGNRLSEIGTRLGVYPYWAGRDMQRMLDRGEDPLRVACDVAHENGLQLFASYRRMTYRMPPFVFPLHPDALLAKRPDLSCVDRNGERLPHLSLAYPEVRAKMVALLAEQAENYDIDGVHFFFSRGVPFIFFEPPFVEAFQREYGDDPRPLPLDDRRVWKLRARFVLPLLRELRSALNTIGSKRNRTFPIAMHVGSSPETCAFYGMDIETMARERLVDILIPDHAYFLPRELGEWHCLPEHVAEFARITNGTAVRLYPHCEGKYAEDNLSPAQRAAAFYAAGAQGLDVAGHCGVVMHRAEFELRKRLGHVGSLGQIESRVREWSRCVRVQTVGGLPLDMHHGVPTCG